MHRGAYQDAYGARNAHLRRNHAPLTQPVVHLRRSEPARGWWGITAELSRNTSSVHLDRFVRAKATFWQYGLYFELILALF